MRTFEARGKEHERESLEVHRDREGRCESAAAGFSLRQESLQGRERPNRRIRCVGAKLDASGHQPGSNPEGDQPSVVQYNCVQRYPRPGHWRCRNRLPSVDPGRIPTSAMGELPQGGLGYGRYYIPRCAKCASGSITPRWRIEEELRIGYHCGNDFAKGRHSHTQRQLEASACRCGAEPSKLIEHVPQQQSLR